MEQRILTNILVSLFIESQFQMYNGVQGILSFVGDPLRLIKPSSFIAPDDTATSSTS